MKRILIAIFILLLVSAVVAQTVPDGWKAGPKQEEIEGHAVKWRSSYEKLGFPNDRLAGVFRSYEFVVSYQPADPDELYDGSNPPLPAGNRELKSEIVRLVRFSGITGEVTVSAERPSEVNRLDKGVGIPIYGVRPPTDWPALRGDERIAMLVEINRPNIVSNTSEVFWDGAAASEARPPTRRPNLIATDLAPSYVPSQLLLNRSKTTVGRLDVHTGVSDILRNRGGTWFDLDARGTVSTQSLDPDAAGAIEFQIGRRFGPSSFDQLHLHLGFRSNQSGRSKAGYFDIGREAFLPGRYSRPSSIAVIGGAPLFSASVRGEQRWHRDEEDTPYHLSPQVVYGMVRAQVGPVWLLPRGSRSNSFLRTAALYVDGRAYGFLGEKGRRGYGARNAEYFLGLDLIAPRSVFHLGPLLLDAYFRTGAFEDQTFRRSTIFGIGLTSRL